MAEFGAVCNACGINFDAGFTGELIPCPACGSTDTCFLCDDDTYRPTSIDPENYEDDEEEEEEEREYRVDVTLHSTVCVRARDEDDAREIVRECYRPEDFDIHGWRIANVEEVD